MKTILTIIYIAGMTLLYAQGHWVVATTSILSLCFGVITSAVVAAKMMKEKK